VLVEVIPGITSALSVPALAGTPVTQRGVAAPDTPVAIIERGSTVRERVIRATICDASRIADEMAVKPPAVIVIGRVALDGLLASEMAATSRP
jgi:uroporphyrin-III C-methyltransferase / precorrin-2 dehydrogenase / sirohydrochlorin ferrochelatase